MLVLSLVHLQTMEVWHQEVSDLSDLVADGHLPWSNVLM